MPALDELMEEGEEGGDGDGGGGDDGDGDGGGGGDEGGRGNRGWEAVRISAAPFITLTQACTVVNERGLRPPRIKNLRLAFRGAT